MRPDVLIAWFNVHGGAFHRLIRLHEVLSASGLACELLFCAGPPRGLKPGCDVPEGAAAELEARGVRLLPRAEVLARARQAGARLTITDAHHDESIPALIRDLRAAGGTTAQMATLLGDFTYHGADALLLQHPLTLFFELLYNATPQSRAMGQARRVYFTGNIFFEPTINRLHRAEATRESFLRDYGLDPAKPLCLWMPNAADADSPAYGEVMRAAEGAGHSLLAKLHPWEYAFKKHGVDPWGLGRTSDEIWGARAVAESDAGWAFHFCDYAVVRASATCLELPFWNKPVLLLPSGDKFHALVQAQGRLIARSSLALSGTDELARRLKEGVPAFGPEDYAASRRATRLDDMHGDGQDAYRQTLLAVRELLDTPPAGSPPLGMRALHRLYARGLPPWMPAILPWRRRALLALMRGAGLW